MAKNSFVAELTFKTPHAIPPLLLTPDNITLGRTPPTKIK